MSEPFPPGSDADGPRPPVAPAEVVVWQVCLDTPALPVDRAQAVLSPAERECAAALRTKLLRDRYVVAHAALRCLLGRSLRLPPEEVAFASEAQGKPVLAARHGRARLHFNLSHSQGSALIAVCDAAPIGVDLECWRNGAAVDDLASWCLAPGEAETLRTLSGSCRERAFLTGWVRKEAFLKATGVGLAMPLDRVEVTMLPGDPPRLVAIDGDPRAACGWNLFDLGTSGFAAALACHGAHPRLRKGCFRLGSAAIYDGGIPSPA